MVEHGHTTQLTISGVIGAAVGVAAKGYAAGMIAAPGWFPYLIQGMVTLIVTSLAVVIGHFLKRWLNRNWPSEVKD